MSQMSDEKIIDFKINTIKKFVNLQKLLHKNYDVGEIQKYYKTNKLAYKFFHSSKGFVHMAISKNSNQEFKKKDLLFQVKTIEKYIIKNNSQNILELACGKGANIKFLAKKYANKNFCGIDLPSGQLTINNKLQNLKFEFADYHNLEQFENSSLDLIFIIEALCHSDKKEVVAKEVFRLLKPGGTFIVFDGYLRKHMENITENQKLASKIVSNGMSVNSFEEYTLVRNKISVSGLKTIYEKDYSKNTIPTLVKYEKWARRVFKYGLLTKLIFKLFPQEFTGNILSGYLMINLVKLGTLKYYLSVFEKK